MKTILVCGAGKSSTYLIEYLLLHSKNHWKLILMDSNSDAVTEKLGGHPRGEAAIIDVMNDDDRRAVVANADLVISLLPPSLHILLAKDCIDYKKNLITASYVSDDIKALDHAAREAGILFMCEMGLDPGIDHMSAMEIFHGIRKIGGDIISFKSYCGGLVAPESDDNPWHYKISWNPRNIVNAGKSGGHWLENDHDMSVEYRELFHQNKKIKLDRDNIGYLSYYPNRDSLKYIQQYQIPEVKSIMRATLRYPQFSRAWHYIVKAGLTDETDCYPANQSLYRDWIAWKTGLPNNENLKTLFTHKYEVDEKSLKQLEWLGIFDDKPIYNNKNYSSADLLQIILEEKWQMGPQDRDMVVMLHQVEYRRKDEVHKVSSSMVCIGEDRIHSAMAKTVGLPMAIFAKRLLLNDNFKDLKGVQIPTMSEVYTPILRELAKEGIEFVESYD